MLSVYPSDSASAALVLAHGAGGGQQSKFMVQAAQAFAARGITVATFDFPYMAQGRSVPDKGPVLEAHWRAVIDEARAHRGVRGAAALHRREVHGRPHRVTGRGAACRRHQRTGLISGIHCIRRESRSSAAIAHLPDITEPMLFVQGTRDPFGTAEEIRALLPRLNPRATLFEVADGDHSFAVRVSVTGKKPDAVLTEIFDAVTSFIQTCANSTSR